MKVILLKDVQKLGRKYDTKDVSSGHALNLLIPKGLAIVATAEAVKRIDILKKQMDGDKKVNEDLLIMNVKGLDGIELRVSGKANEKGNLFAGLHREAIVEQIFLQTKLQIDPAFIQMEHPIKELGEHIIEVIAPSVALDGAVKGKEGKSVKFKLIVEAK